MSRAFVTEGDGPSLEDIPGSVQALIAFLTRENNGIRIQEKKQYTDPQGRQVYEMSNGASYIRDENGRWKVL